MTDRVLIGTDPFGDQVFQITVPGKDVLDPTLVGNDFQFDSRWDGTSLIYQKGIATGWDPIVWPELPYVPLVEVQRWDGVDEVYGETFFNWMPHPSGSEGIYSASFPVKQVFRDGMSYYTNPTGWPNSNLPASPNFIYVVYRIPMPGFYGW